jgi:hypothetical protein
MGGRVLEDCYRVSSVFRIHQESASLTILLIVYSEEIHKRWEDLRGDLTRQYKKRHREAMKRRRRGHGGSAVVNRDE